MKPTLKATFTAMFDSLGLPQVASQRVASPDAAAHLADLFTTMKIDLVIDNSADAGWFGTFLRKQVGYTGAMLSFEAVGPSFNTLKARAAADDRWETEQASLGARGGQLPLNVIDLKNFRASGSSAGNGRQAMRISRETVPVLTLDDVLPPLMARTGARRVFLKLGGDTRDILKGADRTLGKIVALHTELSTSQKLEGVPHYLATLSCLEAKHFTPNAFFRTTRPGALPTRFDCCLVNTNRG